MSEEYRYAIENEHGVTRDVTRAEAQEARMGSYKSAVDLPDGTEFAPGLDNGKPCKVYRVKLDA